MNVTVLMDIYLSSRRFGNICFCVIIYFLKMECNLKYLVTETSSFRNVVIEKTKTINNVHNSSHFY